MPLDLFVPGRVCLLGEHSGWAAGWRRTDPGLAPGCAMLVGTDRGLMARVRRLDDRFRLLASDERGTRRPPIELPFEPLVSLVQAFFYPCCWLTADT